MRSDYLGDFFSSASRFILFVPVVILSVGIIIKLDLLKSQSDVGLKKTYPTSIEVKEMSVTPLPTLETTLSITFNPTQPFACISSGKEATIEAYRKDREVFIQASKDNKEYFFLVHNDCFYQWERQAFGGRMLCGVNQYINLIDSMNMSGNANIGSLINTIQDKNIHFSTQEMQTILNSCKNTAVIPEKVFRVPTNIKFVEEKN